MAHKKVHVPKVVVQTNPPNRILLSAVLFAAFVAVAWYSYKYGRSQVQPGSPGDAGISAQEQQRIAGLEEEREALKAQVDGLQRDMQLSRQALEVARNKIRALERRQTSASPADTPRVETPRVELPAAVSAPVDNRLTLQNVRIAATDNENRFRFSFSVTNPGNATDQVVGTIWIAVNGLLNGEPTRLSLEKVSSNSRPFVKMDFRQRQEVEGELRLPPAFRPKNIMIEAKPYSKKFHETAGKIDWVTSG